jgi:hypothetical protein
MSVDFGCIETCIFPDFEDYVKPFEDEGMSEEEEDYLDYLLHVCTCTEEHTIKYEYHVEQKQISLFAQGKMVIHVCMMNHLGLYRVVSCCEI